MQSKKKGTDRVSFFFFFRFFCEHWAAEAEGSKLCRAFKKGTDPAMHTRAYRLICARACAYEHAEGRRGAPEGGFRRVPP